jgi:hypothetical protein
VCVLLDLQRDQELSDLVARARKVISGFPELTELPDRLLSAVVCSITTEDGTLDRISRERLVLELSTRLALLTPFTLTAGCASAETGSVLLDLDQDQPGEVWNELSNRVHDAVWRVVDGPPDPQFPAPPHLDLAHCAVDCDSGVIQRQLRVEVRPTRAAMFVDAVYLARIVFDEETHEQHFGPDAIRIPLGGRIRRECLNDEG